MIIVTHPGKLGDLLWALPAVRAIAQKDQVKLWLSPWCTPLVPLLECQDYISAVYVDELWQVQDTAPMTPRIPPGLESPAISAVHLGYVGWPQQPLPFETAEGFDVSWEPWITAPLPMELLPANDLLLTWTDRWFELKFGISALLRRSLRQVRGLTVAAPDSRWVTEAGWLGCSISVLAEMINLSQLVLTDCSMAHVLAAAMGKRVVVMEPEHDRHHPIFWPGVSIHPDGTWQRAANVFADRIVPVLGNDGRPTFDARHTRELIESLL